MMFSRDERFKAYPVTGWELWSIMLLGWLALPLVLLIRRETDFAEDDA